MHRASIIVQTRRMWPETDWSFWTGCYQRFCRINALYEGDRRFADVNMNFLLCACSLQMKPSELGMRFGVAFAGSFLIVLGLVSISTCVCWSYSVGTVFDSTHCHDFRHLYFAYFFACSPLIRFMTCWCTIFGTMKKCLKLSQDCTHIMYMWRTTGKPAYSTRKFRAADLFSDWIFCCCQQI